MHGLIFKKWIERVNLKYFIIIIVLLSLTFRVIHITADTPLLRLFSDEGYKTFDARNKTLTGSWNVPPHPPCYLYLHPIFTLVQYVFLSLFGVGYIQARLVSVLLSMGIIMLMFTIMRKHFGDHWAAVAAIFTGFNYYFIMISRTAVIEIPTIFFMMLTVFLFINGRQKSICYYLSGVTCIIAVITKLYAIFLFPTIVFCFIFKKQFKEIAYFLGGIFSALLIYALFWLIFTNSETLLEIIKLNFNISRLEILRTHKSIALTLTNFIDTGSSELNFLFKLLKSILGRIIYLNHLFIMAPSLFIFTGCYFILLFSKSTKIKISDIEWVCINWLFWGAGLLIISKYASVHHLIILFPPMIILSTAILKYYCSNYYPI